MSTLFDVEQGAGIDVAKAGPVMGIDPGLDGAISWVGDEGADAMVMPVLAGGPDAPALVRLFEEKRPSLVVLESASIRPRESGKSGLTIGRNWGVIVGVLVALRIKHEIVAPDVWKRQIGLVTRETGPKGETEEQKAERLARQKKKRKEEAILLAQRLYPDVDLRRSARAEKPHDGKAESLLLAEYGRRQGGAL